MDHTCGELAAQIGDRDELLIIHDVDNNPAAERRTIPEGVQLIVAGNPTHCSGETNAIATGMDAARHDRLVWTDDDFHHPPDWLATLSANYERYEPVSEVPYFVGEDPLSVLLEPVYASGGSLASISEITSGVAWAYSIVTISTRPRFSGSFVKQSVITDSP
ncbi:glycosyltransferase [Halalkalicoccus subterraneus]|uniref:glycosyltransferase n=1 Tax=Halalkalicoccus subterraneus TaxID=2675002 RepID=UPI001FE5771E|nr:glycosyltransferase [Halalkalicoccus subterraneus]